MSITSTDRTPAQLAALCAALVAATYDSGDDRAFYPEDWAKIDARIHGLTDRAIDAIGENGAYRLYDWDSTGAIVVCNGCEHQIRYSALVYPVAYGRYKALLTILAAPTCERCESRDEDTDEDTDAIVCWQSFAELDAEYSN